MKGTVTVLGDLVSPLDEPWDALEAWDDDARGFPGSFTAIQPTVS